jgi:catechol 2,3-dioxygenase-like lactoylglutathione lyase family enzyme
MTSRFRGVFLTSEHPDMTAKFYEQVAGLRLAKIGGEDQYVYWRFDADGMQLAIHDAKAFSGYTYPALAASNLTHLYFKIADQRAFLSHLEQVAITPIGIDDVVVTVVDPDGRKVMFGTA